MLTEWFTSILKKITLNLDSAISEPPTAETISLIPFGGSKSWKQSLALRGLPTEKLFYPRTERLCDGSPHLSSGLQSAGHWVTWLSVLFLFGSLPFSVLFENRMKSPVISRMPQMNLSAALKHLDKEISLSLWYLVFILPLKSSLIETELLVQRIRRNHFMAFTCWVEKDSDSISLPKTL